MVSEQEVASLKSLIGKLSDEQLNEVRTAMGDEVSKRTKAFLDAMIKNNGFNEVEQLTIYQMCANYSRQAATKHESNVTEQLKTATDNYIQRNGFEAKVRGDLVRWACSKLGVVIKSLRFGDATKKPANAA